MRSAILVLLGVLSVVVALTPAQAQTYPSKTVRYIVPSSAGGGSDYMSRIIAEELSAAFGQQVIVDNRAGAASNLGAEVVTKSAPDGYTVLQVRSPTDRLPPGKGVVRRTEVFQLLMEKDYQGYMSYEAPNPAQWNRPALEVALDGAEATRRLIVEAEESMRNR
jgi:hypothetical protein